MKENYNVYGMSCAACSGRVDQTVRKLDIVKDVSVNLLTGKMQVEYVEGETDAEKCEGIVCEAVKKAGYTAIVASKDNGALKKETSGSAENACSIGGECGKKPKKKWSASSKRLIASIVFLLVLVYITMGKMIGLPHPDIINSEINPHINALVQMILALLVIICAKKMYINGWRNLFRLSPNMDTLISVGSSISFVYSLVYLVMIIKNYSEGNIADACDDVHKLFFESAAMIPTFISIGKFLEERSKAKTTDALRKLINMRPAKAILYLDGEERIVDISEVKPGDVLAVKPGATIPCDGTIVYGEGSIDESMLTGESLPVEKEIGASVFEATINQNGYFRMTAEKTGENTVFSQIIKLVEEASSSKAPIQRLADKISLYFVPIVLGISLLTFVVWMIADGNLSFAISMAVSVMVISCPCSLGLATPTAIMAGTGKGAELGILIKSAESLEKLHSCDTFLFDKTGTITYGRLSVNSVIPALGVDEKELVGLA